MRRRAQRHGNRHSGFRAPGSVNLISMMDILTVLLLFLLKSYVAGGEVMVPAPGVRLPASTAERPPQASLVVAIDRDEIMVGGESVASLAEVMRSEALEIAPLAERLQLVQGQEKEIARLGGRAVPERRVATIQGDRFIQFRVLKKVMFTLHRNGYEDIALAVLQKPGVSS